VHDQTVSTVYPIYVLQLIQSKWLKPLVYHTRRNPTVETVGYVNHLSSRKISSLRGIGPKWLKRYRGTSGRLRHEQAIITFYNRTGNPLL
jgi:hypothetical protein